ncbi:hypothetical protein [Selenomonas sp. AE3005]|uniref:hypothetical protein n=1 Tax=Selenomonas sp. AE3005 TaxID=1485543 RepID=UPI0025E7BBDB|nr:hypothetical protein [Selenomonas sp. AE3005]
MTIAMGIAVIYFAAKYIVTKISMLSYIYWMEEEKRTQPTKEQLDACRKKVIHEMFK